LVAARIEAADQAVEASDREVSAAENALQREIEARERGEAHKVETAQKEFIMARANQARALAEQEKAQRAQRRIQTLEQATSLTTASAKIWSSFSGLGPAGPFLAIGAIASMWGSFIGAKVRAAQLSKREFSEGGFEIVGGGSHATDNDTPLGFSVDGKPAFVESGEGVGIVRRSKTHKYKRLLPQIFDSLNKGTFENVFTRIGEDVGALNVTAQAAPNMATAEKYLKQIANRPAAPVVADGKIVFVEGNTTRIIYTR
jgi:hypothetical protein